MDRDQQKPDGHSRMSPATHAAAQYVAGRRSNPSVLGIEKDASALRRAIDSGAVVEVSEDTWVTLTTDHWDSHEGFRAWSDDISRLGYRDTLFIRRFEPDPRQGVPPLFGGTRMPVAGEPRYVAACYYEPD